MKIHILQHVAFEGPGYIAQWAKEHEHELSFIKFFEPGHHFPDIEAIDALIVLGGPMDVFDEHEYQWLHPEKVFIENCILMGKKVLGICLGAQLAAQCVGATICTAPQKEIGWFPVFTTEHSKVLPWFAELFKDQPTVLHWHGDKFQIPYGGYELLRSAGNSNQAFFFTGNVLGLQFHLEAKEESLKEMIANCGHELHTAPYIQTEVQILSGKEHLARNQQLMASVLQNFLEPIQHPVSLPNDEKTK